MLSSSFVWEDRGAQGILPFTHCHPLLRILWAPDVLIWKKAWCRPQGSRTDGKVMAAVPGATNLLFGSWIYRLWQREKLERLFHFAGSDPSWRWSSTHAHFFLPRVENKPERG
uniref:Uncharacterized protein LOC112814329 isoform X3 n=1 Tax=Callorhinus ursinus TaxID=34884 RepID=A0A3Q7PI71_CALUR|nr:uncharacterized protein LOC112814329 isoform X3 [Callorhinus ursinus]